MPLLLACWLLMPALALATGAGRADALHFLQRTGLGAGDSQIDEWARLTRGEMIERALAEAATVARTPPPAWVGEWTAPRQVRDLGEAERKLFVREQARKGAELKAWWARELLNTPAPLTERMTLFWHNHFTSSLQKVRSPTLMYRQNALLRAHALGSFRELLRAASRDPAMLLYLDAASNRRGRPNENFARELMELFTLGEGRYSEADIREAARALTGWSVDLDTGDFLWRAFAHDPGEKAILGRRGNFKGEDVIDLLLLQPATAEFIVAKLWKEFVSPAPQAGEVGRIAQVFRGADYDIRAALRALWSSEDFWAAQNRAVLVKSPVDLVIGTLRRAFPQQVEAQPVAMLLRRLGQDLFAPPNVRGWPGGEAWINSGTLLARRQFLERVARGDHGREGGDLSLTLLDPAYQLK